MKVNLCVMQEPVLEECKQRSLTLLDNHFLLFQLNAHKHKEKHGPPVHITATH